MIYLHLFENDERFNDYINNSYEEPFVSVTNIGNDNYRVNYNQETIDYRTIPLTFEIISGGTIVWTASGSGVEAKTIEYKKNDGQWTSITSVTGNGTTISVDAGDIVQFRGNNATYANAAAKYNTFGASTAIFNVYGNIMSLINSSTFQNSFAFETTFTFAGLFLNCSGIIDAKNFILPATALTESCYYKFFQNCTNLVIAPSLPSTTLYTKCYVNMFQGCTSLTIVPELPATALTERCYYNMFYGCTSLATAPALPATTLTNYCYYNMFYGCTSLTTAPELPATTLLPYCYQNMLRNCTSLNYIKCLATDISATSCTNNWVTDVQTTSGTFVKSTSMNDWTTGINGIPENWTVQDAS